MAAAAGALIGIFLLQSVSAQYLYPVANVSGNGICSTIDCRDLDCMQRLNDCVVIVGNLTLTIVRMKRWPEMFDNIKFVNLKEITGFMALYEVPFLDSLGTLFPNLARIRGRDVFNDYALMVFEMPQLIEIGLYSLVKIDRGGVIMWGGTATCYIDTIDWNTITPGSRHVLSPFGDMTDLKLCKKLCRCSNNASYNFCWNNKRCQRFLDGPEAYVCDEQCLGCRNINSSHCLLCRNYTHKGRCVTKCPSDTIILEDNQYCITKSECHSLNRWVWNNTCISTCPDDHVMVNDTAGLTCKFFPNCTKYCGSLVIRSLRSIQEAHRCVFVNGSLKIHIRGVPQAVEEMRVHLRNIEEVTDFVVIEDSISLTTIDFLSSLRRIRGKKLLANKYSLAIKNNPNLQKVFMSNVTKDLKIDKGTLTVFNNSMLCMSEIHNLSNLFPEKPDDILDIPIALNSYSACCEEVALNLNVSVINETSAIVWFVPLPDPYMNYSILYVRVPPGKHTTVVPETCSEYEWHSVNVGNYSKRVELNTLRPASTYLLCIESFSLEKKLLARSSIVNFTTHVGKPEPPFIVELSAASSDVAVLHWVDHVDYRPHIIRYELDLMLIDIQPEDTTASNQCKNLEEEFIELDIISRHAVVMRPPPHYGKGCESMCGILSTAPHGALVEDNFDICSSIGFYCNEIEEENVSNTSLGQFVRTASLNITAPKTSYQVGKLAPYRDYRFRLRACTDDRCSRSTRSVVRTLLSVDADVPTISFVKAEPNGIITIFWDAPAVSNGPVLAYILEIIPDAKVSDVGTLQPQTWCVPSNQSSIQVKSEKANGMRLCSLSLASRTGCTEFIKLVTTQLSSEWGLAGAIFAIPLCIVSLVIGYLWTRWREQSDTVPLVDITSSYRIDSEPIFSILDFTPSWHSSQTD
ncbi:insulin-like peptide receptor [Choristoneura fumiferana]|uniref:insulin-like peptide receptor n=1 Tax=Choristoneura fumiferana TaxID=7141 RepID=UPI003D15E0C4